MPGVLVINFFNFLREKNFIAPLSPAQIDALRRNVQAVNCSNCGAPIDLAHTTTCAHCGSPLSMLDLHQAEHLVATLKAAGKGPHAPDTTPLPLPAKPPDVDTAFGRFANSPGWYGLAASEGLISAALNILTESLI